MSNTNTTSTATELRVQWSNPTDILSLLLLIGGDIVQKAIAQLVGYSFRIRLWKSTVLLPIVPVAFSFGWVAYSFSNLLSTFGDAKLMPVTDCPSLVVTCSNGFVRENQSWVLGRLLRDHQARHKVDPRNKTEGGREESIRIDVFELKPVSGCDLDFIWWSGWITIAAQIGIAIPPYYLYRDWGIMLIVLSGNVLALITCAFPQWSHEKWAGRRLNSENVICLTGGNGFKHIMVFLGQKGCWNFESMATRESIPQSETRFISLILALLWTCLLISVSGLKNNAWFLVGIGGLGMIQNVFAAGAARDPSSFGIHATRSIRVPSIIGRRIDYDDDTDAEVDLPANLQELDELDQWVTDPTKVQIQIPQWLSTMNITDNTPQWLSVFPPEEIIGVHGALMELEKWVPTAGLSMVQIFFPTGLKYEAQSIRDNVHKKFWKRAYHTKDVRSKADKKRRSEENRLPKSRMNSV